MGVGSQSSISTLREQGGLYRCSCLPGGLTFMQREGPANGTETPFVVQNSLDLRTFAKLKSEIFISQGRMK